MTLAQTTAVDLGYRPRPIQAELHRTVGRFAVIVCHRRFGKTYWAARHLLGKALRFPRADGRFGHAFPFANQAREAVWFYYREFTRNIPGVRLLEQDMKVMLPNGSEIRVFGMDRPDNKLGVYFDGLILDEYAKMKPSAWTTVLRPMLADRMGFAVFIGTPRGMDHFYDLYCRGMRGEPGWTAHLYPVTVTGYIDAAEIEAMKTDVSEIEFAQEFLCDFSASNERALIKIIDIEQARSRIIHEHQLQGLPKIIGIDCKEQGGDETVIFRRWGDLHYPFQTFNDHNDMHIAGMCANYINNWGADGVVIDRAFGNGVISHLQHMGYGARVYGIHFGQAAMQNRFLNIRAEMMFTLAEAVRDSAVIPDDPKFIQELSVTEYEIQPNGKIKIEDKKKIRDKLRRSPDRMDAAALTYATPIVARSAFNTTRYGENMHPVRL